MMFLSSLGCGASPFYDSMMMSAMRQPAREIVTFGRFQVIFNTAIYDSSNKFIGYSNSLYVNRH